MTLPPLPEPTDVIRVNTQLLRAFTATQMTAYGQQCYRAGLEEAAKLAEGHYGDGFRLAEEIRSLK